MVNYNRTSQTINRQHAMLNDIQKLQFAALDIALFLDTHPNDPVALYRHHAYTEQLKQYREIYEAQYGPLTIFGMETGDTWRYINGPWPWE